VKQQPIDFDWSSIGVRRRLPDPDDENERALVGFAVTELRQVMRVRLLGRDPELFGAVDRHRAEVEFRLAVLPPLLALAAAAGFRSSPTSAALVVLLALVATGGLFLDALERQREANDILVDALADRRVQAPSLEWLESLAASIGGRQKTDAMRTAAAEFEKALDDGLRRLRSTDPRGELDRAVESVALARRCLQAIGASFSGATVDASTQAVVALEHTIEMWRSGAQPPYDEWRSDLALTLDVAEESRLEFRRLALDEVAHVSERPSRDTDAPEAPGVYERATPAET
jgi:hypothetical protein